MNVLKVIIDNLGVILGTTASLGALFYKVPEYLLCSDVDIIFYTKTQRFIKRTTEWFILSIIHVLGLFINASIFFTISSLQSYSSSLLIIEKGILLVMLVVIIMPRFIKKPIKNTFLNIVAKECVVIISYIVVTILLSISLSFSYEAESFKFLLCFYSIILACYIVSYIMLINNISGYVHYFIKDGIMWFIQYNTSKKEMLCTNTVDLDCSNQLHYFETAEIKKNYVINREKHDATAKERKNNIKKLILQLKNKKQK